MRDNPFTPAFSTRSEDSGNSRMADIAARLGVSAGYAAQYRRRLMEAGVIGQKSRGVVGFELPGWREFMKFKLAEWAVRRPRCFVKTLMLDTIHRFLSTELAGHGGKGVCGGRLVFAA